MAKSRLLAAAFVLNGAAAMKQSWTFKEEDRPHFFIERFGFGPSGHMDVHVSNVEIDAREKSQIVQAGLLFVHVRNELSIEIKNEAYVVDKNMVLTLEDIVLCDFDAKITF